MTIQILDGQINTLVRRDDDLKLALAKANSVKVVTINRWLREDAVILTTTTNLDIIRNGLGLSEDAVMTEAKDFELQS